MRGDSYLSLAQKRETAILALSEGQDLPTSCVVKLWFCWFQ